MRKIQNCDQVFVVEDQDVVNEVNARATSDKIYQDSDAQMPITLQLDLGQDTRSMWVMMLLVELVRRHKRTIVLVADMMRQAALVERLKPILAGLRIHLEA